MKVAYPHRERNPSIAGKILVVVSHFIIISRNITQMVHNIAYRFRRERFSTGRGPAHCIFISKMRRSSRSELLHPRRGW